MGTSRAFTSFLLMMRTAQSSSRRTICECVSCRKVSTRSPVLASVSRMARLRNWSSRSPCASSTINRMASAVRAVWKEAGSQGYVHPLVARAFGEVEGASERALKGNQRPHSQVDIKPEAMREMVELAQGEQLLQLRNRAILLTLASTGLRVENFRQLTHWQIVRREEEWGVRNK